MTSKRGQLLKVAGLAGGAAAAAVWSSYRKDLAAATRRITKDARRIHTAEGTVEYAIAGEGRPALVIHGAGGGFDQGLELGRFLGDGYRIIAPSRFGYLGTPMPVDASPEAQADAHVRLLDALQLDRVPVVAVSAGAPSAVQLCLRHRERCSALILIVPMAYAPDRATVGARWTLFDSVLDTIVTSDLLYWLATRVARETLVRTILGTPVKDYRNATPAQKEIVDSMLRHILPISLRAAGIANDSAVSSTLIACDLEKVRVPTLVISAADDLYGTYDSGLYTAEQIHDGKFIGFPAGGHLLLGHEDAVRRELTKFLKERVHGEERAPIAM